jgi:hemoglobin
LVCALGQADDKPLERIELDRRIVKAVYETSLAGTEIFNNGKHDECFRYYQGALAAIHPLLDHRPKLQNTVKDKLDKASRMKGVEGAFVLREALDEIQNEIAPGPKKLWERLGGEKGVRAVVRDLILLSIENPKVNLLRDGKFKLDAKGVANLEQLLVELISKETGGPLTYSGKRDLKEVHAGMKITDGEFDAMAADLLRALEKHKLGKQETEELMKVFDSTRPLIVEAKKKGM